MTPEDLVRLRAAARALPAFAKVALLSPCKDERRVFRSGKAIFRADWDLNRRTATTYDLVVACNVFMYAPQPELWLRNVLASTRYLLFSEPMQRQRSAEQEWGNDGDAARFTAPLAEGAIEGAFDLALLGDRLLGSRVFDGGNNEFGPARHIQALLLGDLLCAPGDMPTPQTPSLGANSRLPAEQPLALGVDSAAVVTGRELARRVIA